MDNHLSREQLIALFGSDPGTWIVKPKKPMPIDPIAAAELAEDIANGFDPYDMMGDDFQRPEPLNPAQIAAKEQAKKLTGGILKIAPLLHEDPPHAQPPPLLKLLMAIPMFGLVCCSVWPSQNTWLLILYNLGLTGPRIYRYTKDSRIVCRCRWEDVPEFTPPAIVNLWRKMTGRPMFMTIREWKGFPK